MVAPIVASTAISSSGASAVTQLNITRPAGLAEDDLLVILAGNDDVTDNVQFDNTTYNIRNQSDGTDAGFTFIATAGSSAPQAHAGAWYKRMTAADVSSGSWRVDALSSDNLNAIAVRVSGQHLTSPLDIVGAAEENGSNANHNWDSSVTTTVDECLVLHIGSFDGGDCYPFVIDGTSVTAGWTETASVQSSTASDTNALMVGQKDQAIAADAGGFFYNASVADGAAGFFFAIAPVLIGTANKNASDSGIIGISDEGVTNQQLVYSDQSAINALETGVPNKIVLDAVSVLGSTETASVNVGLTQKVGNDSGIISIAESNILDQLNTAAKAGSDSGILGSTETNADLAELDLTAAKAGNDAGIVSALEGAIVLGTDVNISRTDSGILSIQETRNINISGTILVSSSDSSVLFSGEIVNVTKPKSASDTFDSITSIETAVEISKLTYDPTWEEDEVTWGGIQLGSKDFAPIYLSGNFFYVLARGGNNLNASLERRAIVFDQGRALLGRGVYPQIIGPTGSIISISLGGQQNPDGAVDWEGPYDFIIGEDIYVDFAVAGRYLAIRFESTSIPVWQLQSYDIDYEIVGVY